MKQHALRLKSDYPPYCTAQEQRSTGDDSQAVLSPSEINKVMKAHMTYPVIHIARRNVRGVNYYYYS
eukprot:6203035-Pleurochrysis_carterae.AAC.2